MERRRYGIALTRRRLPTKEEVSKEEAASPGLRSPNELEVAIAAGSITSGVEQKQKDEDVAASDWRFSYEMPPSASDRHRWRLAKQRKE